MSTAATMTEITTDAWGAKIERLEALDAVMALVGAFATSDNHGSFSTSRDSRYERDHRRSDLSR